MRNSTRLARWQGVLGEHPNSTKRCGAAPASALLANFAQRFVRSTNASSRADGRCYLPPVGDDEVFDFVAARLAALPGVEVVTLGGSRVEGTRRPDSDWDLPLYYRGHF